MTDRHVDGTDGVRELTDGVSRRKFIQGVIVASAAATGITALPVGMTVAMADAPVSTALTAGQLGVLATVLDRLIPASGAMPGAGTLGIGGFIDLALASAPHLRPHVVGVLTSLPEADEIGSKDTEWLDSRLREIEQRQPEAFDLLLQATYTGYYRDPRVLAALGGVPSDREGELRFERFDV